MSEDGSTLLQFQILNKKMLKNSQNFQHAVQSSRNDICYFCGKPAVSKEDVPPKCLFENPRPRNLIRVPSCELHNAAKCKDDEYFRWFITTISGESAKAVSLVENKIFPRFRRKPALLFEIWKGAIPNVKVFSDGGIYLGTQPGFKFNRPRVQIEIEHICRGLFFHHFKRSLPLEYKIVDFIHYPKIGEKMQRIISSLPLHDIGDGSVFSYKFLICSEDSNVVMWFLMFLNHSLLMVMSTKKMDIYTFQMAAKLRV